MRALNQYTKMAPAAFVRIGLQELLLDLCCVLIAARLKVPAKGGNPETGFVLQVEVALNNPTEGGLLNLLRWLIKQDLHPGAAALLDRIKGPKGKLEWLGAAVDLRNQAVHGAVDQEAVHQLLERAPDWEPAGRMDAEEAGVVWCSDSGKFELHPLIQLWEGSVVRIKQLKVPLEAAFEEGIADCGRAFAEYWQGVRVRDLQLSDPQATDFNLKAREFFAPPGAGDGLPDGHLLCQEVQEMIFLVEDGLADAVLRSEHFIGSRLIVDLSPESGTKVAESIARGLGLARAPLPGQLLEWAGEAAAIFVLRTHQLSSVDLRPLFLWLADLREYGDPRAVRILVERHASLLAEDQEMIGDDLPPLYSLLCPVKKEPYETLSDYLIQAESRPVRRLSWS